MVASHGILASNYIAVQYHQQVNKTQEIGEVAGGYVRLSGIGTIKWLHQADVAHMWMSPLRIVCGQRPSVCHDNNNHHYHNNSQGMLSHVAWVLWLAQEMENKSFPAQFLVLIPTLVILSIFMAVEYLLGMASSGPPSLVAMLVALAMIVAIAGLESRIVISVQHKTKDD